VGVNLEIRSNEVVIMELDEEIIKDQKYADTLEKKRVETQMREIDDSIRFDPDKDRIMELVKKYEPYPVTLTSEEAAEYGVLVPDGSMITIERLKAKSKLRRLKDLLFGLLGP
jgi:hypothetical protein